VRSYRQIELALIRAALGVPELSELAMEYRQILAGYHQQSPMHAAVLSHRNGAQARELLLHRNADRMLLKRAHAEFLWVWLKNFVIGLSESYPPQRVL